MAKSSNERRRWDQLHQRVIEESLHAHCHVLIVDTETGTMMGTFSFVELQEFAKVRNCVLCALRLPLTFVALAPAPCGGENG
jgi:hypothetical protein